MVILLREELCHELPRRYGSTLSLEKATVPYLPYVLEYFTKVK